MKFLKKLWKFQFKAVFSPQMFGYFFLLMFFAFFPLAVKKNMGKNGWLLLLGVSEIGWVLTVIFAIKYLRKKWKN